MNLSKVSSSQIDIIKKVNFVSSYSFIYSQRPGTPAVERDQVLVDTCKDRLLELQNLLAAIQLRKNQQLVGKKIQILVENKTKQAGQFFGRSKFMHSVFFNSNQVSDGDLLDIEISSCNKNNLFGVLQKEQIFA